MVDEREIGRRVKGSVIGVIKGTGDSTVVISNVPALLPDRERRRSNIRASPCARHLRRRGRTRASP
jgi:hypothetical protein